MDKDMPALSLTGGVQFKFSTVQSIEEKQFTPTVLHSLFYYGSHNS